MAIHFFDVRDALARYAQGYFPMYSLPEKAGEKGAFFWDRWEVRAVVRVNEQTVGKARRMVRRAARERFEIRYTTAVEEVIAQLQLVKEHSWVQEKVVALYLALQGAGLLRTVEAWTREREPRLAGALLGLLLPGVFVAETMYGIFPEASKVCLCRLVEDCVAEGIGIIDVQTPHDEETMLEMGHSPKGSPHPCVRLGEEMIPLEAFLEEMKQAWGLAFAGGVAEWIAHAGASGMGVPRHVLKNR